jgi:hypothetical protein
LAIFVSVLSGPVIVLFVYVWVFEAIAKAEPSPNSV